MEFRIRFCGCGILRYLQVAVTISGEMMQCIFTWIYKKKNQQKMLGYAFAECNGLFGLFIFISFQSILFKPLTPKGAQVTSTYQTLW